ncbi:MAG: DNA polymerase III subunit epsilon [Wenzhouxiangellaceae bacterium]|nr:DNA polymerase III subunit epsilon [Wenzhouxiangellaceae bacterium]
MRQVVLDTETTGLEPEEGHRIIEIGALELVNRALTGRKFHRYINPERSVETGALNVHGLSDEFLEDKPVFADIAGEFIDFVRDAELVIHNAAFDVGFLDAELGRLPEPVRVVDLCAVLDTLELAREMHPGQRNSLDALCRRYEVDNSNRTLHGALLDSELLAEVYLLMTGGQTSLGLDFDASPTHADSAASASVDVSRLVVRRADAEETAAHEACLDGIEKASGERGCLWRTMESAPD